MGLFPTDAIDGDEVTNLKGTTFKYDDVDNKWYVVNDLTISNIVYDEATWNDNGDGATKNALRDKFESLSTPNHNDLGGLNAGDNYEHITQAQKDLLHAIYTDVNARASISNIIGSDGHLDANLDADQHKVVDLANCTSDNDAARKKYVDDEIAGAGGASIVIGIYTGDGVGNGADWTAKKSITGLGFTPKMIFIGQNIASEAANIFYYVSMNIGNSEIAFQMDNALSRATRLRIVADGFDVADDGTNQVPNANGATYKYVAMG